MRRAIDLLAANRVRLSRADALDELRADIMRVAYVEGEFVFGDGRFRSRYYLDKYLFETRPALLRRLSAFVAALVPEGTDRLAAPALGAVALGTAVSLEVGLPLVIVRPEDGRRRATEGELYDGEAVTLVEDVVVTGSRALGAIARLEAVGARVGHVVSVLDRSEPATSPLAARGIVHRALFTPEQLGIAPEGGR